MDLIALTKNDLGELDAVAPHVQFDEEGRSVV